MTATLKALIAVDGSASAEQAVTFADRLLPTDAEVLLVDVVEPERPLVTAGHVTGLTQPIDALPAIERERSDAAGAELRDAAETMAWRDPDTIVDHGLVAGRLVELAGEHDCDLLVVGTRDPGWWTRFWSPSISRHVAANAPCSVLVVR